MRPGDIIGMGSVTVEKAALLAVVRENRAKHRAVFERAVEVFRGQANERLEALARELRESGSLPKTLYVGLPIPEEHTDDYDRAIRMLEMHIHDVVELSEEAYRRVVEDDWGWQQTFATNTRSYLAGA
jgi:hypothetical protein